MPESPLENITLRNIRFTVRQPEDCAKRRKPVGGDRKTSDALYARAATYAALANINGLTIDDLSVKISEADFQKYPRSAAAMFNVQGARLKNVTRMPADGAPPSVEQANCKDVESR
jgi:hypothetical protein